MTNGKKGKQTLIAAGNWVWSLFTANVAWFLINFTMILTVILLSHLPIGIPFFAIGLILIGMLAVFTLPSLTAVFAAVDRWEIEGSGTLFTTVFKNWLLALKQWQNNLIFASLLGGIGLLMKIFQHNVLLNSFVITWGIILLMVIIANAYLKGSHQEQDLIQFMKSHLFRLLLSTLTFVVLILINGFLRLAFLMLICSISLSAVITFKLLKNKKLVKSE
ncbi:membrane protein [Lactobacillus selangorensis]|uniref:Membrane protein n=1 Tax=Lactobacillus selangorensis TaxID=81857 RepID=A0A0R2FWJ2_9LACO|nr:hypothetical protein [Lactobacillus selangorensis]KRN28861.1 membrane protein [Lactobacillus selangorensis]KRN32729.1 membrane protein [Lactobacillus selangorensis]